MKRYIYAFDTTEAARKAVADFRTRGIKEEAISLIARSDIEMEKIPPKFLDASTDFGHALARGTALGGATGLVAGMIALAIPPLGITMAGPALLAFLGGGALVGAWSSSMFGAGLADEVRRKFDDEIEAGRTLLVIDSDGDNDAIIATTLAGGDDRHLVWQSEVKTPVK